MITAKFNLSWTGKRYTESLHKELVTAVQKNALLVQRQAKELLNKSGKGHAGIRALNRTDRGLKGAAAVKKRFSQGMTAMRKNIKGFQTNAGDKVFFGGSFKFQDKKTGSISRVDNVYWYGNPLHRWVQAAPYGDPPHKQTGTLQRSIMVEKSHAGLRAKVGPAQQLKYARRLEFQGHRYMGVAFEMNVNKMMLNFYQAIAKADKFK